jgi:signal peptidase I
MVGILKRIGGFFLDIIQTVVLALSIFVVIYLFFFAPHQVKGQSMFPNFHDGEFLLTDKFTYRFHLPKRGETIIFMAPASEACAEVECEYIKRIVGLPGERIKIQGGQVFINGQVLAEDYLPADERIIAGSLLKEGAEFLVPGESYIVLGDNRPHSRDSREFGPIKKEAIIGRAFLRYWPPDRMGLIMKNEK